MKRTFLLTTMIALLLALLVTTGCKEEAEEAAATDAVEAIAAVVPSTDFEVKDMHGAELKLADYRGDVVIVDFWATWCGPCRMVMPHLEKIHREYADQGIRVIALSVDRGAPDLVKAFVGKNQYTFPVGMATAGIVRAYGGVPSIPTTFIVGPDGTIAEKMVGAHPMEEYLAAAKRAQTGTEEGV